MSKNNMIAVTRRILAAVESIAKSLKDNAKGTGESHKADEEKTSEKQDVRATVSLPQGVETRQSEKDATSESTYRRRTLIVSIAGLLLVLAYTTVAAFQWCEIRRSNSINREAMITGTRAYLALGRVTIYCPICSTGKIEPPSLPTPYSNNASISIFFINTGRSPARDIETGTMLYVVPMDKDFAFPEKPDALEQPKHASAQASTEFPLQITRGMRAEAILSARGQIPCGDTRTKCTTPLYIYGHVSYTDVFQHRHTLLYCTQFQTASDTSPEQWNLCPRHNDEYEGDYKPGYEPN